MSEEKKLKKLALTKVAELKKSKDNHLRLTIDGGELGRGFRLVKVPLKKKMPRDFLLVGVVTKDDANAYFICEQRL
jgi:hypothetical protein